MIASHSMPDYLRYMPHDKDQSEPRRYGLEIVWTGGNASIEAIADDLYTLWQMGDDEIDHPTVEVYGIWDFENRKWVMVWS